VFEFFTDLADYRFLQHALLTGLLASVACGIIGSYVVTRRITYIAGSIAHSVLGGLGAARYAQVVHGWHWFNPLYGAIAAAVAAAVIIGAVSLYAREREDTVIGAMWAIGMSAGILFIFKTPGYDQDLMSYLFGNILMVSANDLRLIAMLDLVIVALTLVFYRTFLAVCFDEEFARLQGVPVERYYLLLLCMTALTVVLLVTVVGIVMVIALLTIPVAIAGNAVRRLGSLMILSGILTACFTTGGLVISYSADLPAGATTIIIAGGIYFCVLVLTGVLPPPRFGKTR